MLGAALVTGALMLGVYTIVKTQSYGWGSAHTRAPAAKPPNAMAAPAISCRRVVVIARLDAFFVSLTIPLLGSCLQTP